jgi:hypothetical protein
MRQNAVRERKSAVVRVYGLLELVQTVSLVAGVLTVLGVFIYLLVGST